MEGSLMLTRVTSEMSGVRKTQSKETVHKHCTLVAKGVSQGALR